MCNNPQSTYDLSTLSHSSATAFVGVCSNLAPMFCNMDAFEPLRASEKPYFPRFASFCHMNLRIRKPSLYPLSYEGALDAKVLEDFHFRVPIKLTLLQ